MFDILGTIYHDDPMGLGVVCSLEDPESPEERKIANQLRAVDEKTAQALRPSIEALANRQAKLAFYKGVRFGAQLTLQLVDETETPYI